MQLKNREDFIILEIEGTAHTIGIGIIDENGNILADQRSIFSPKTGGIQLIRKI